MLKYPSAKNKDVTWAITAGDAATINATGLLTADASKTGAVTIEVRLKMALVLKALKLLL